MPTATLKIIFNLLALGLASAMAFFLATKAIPGDDAMWRSLAQGRLIAETGEIPKTDPFVFSLPPSAGFDSDGWFFSLAAYALRQYAGAASAQILRAALLLGCFAFLLAAAFRRQARPFSCAIFSLAALYSLLPYSAFSPALAGYFFFAAALFLMEGEFWAAFFGRWLWLPLLMVVWVNMNTSALLLPLLAGLWAFSERKAASPLTPQFPGLALMGTLGVLAACAFLHPALWRVPALAAPPMLAPPFEPGAFLEARPALAMLGASAVTLLGAGALPQGKEHARRDLLVFFGLALPALLWRGLLPYACLFAAPMAAARADSIVDALPGMLSRLRWILKISLLGAAAVYFPAVLALSSRPALEAPRPKDTVGFFRDELLQGRVFNDNDWAGALLWQLSPGLSVFSDGRRGAALDYVRILQAAEGWEKLLDRHGADFAWLKINSPLAKAMARSLKWQPVDFDDVSVLYARASPENAGLIKTWAPRGLRPGDLDEPFEESRLPQVEADLESRRLKRPASGILHYFQARYLLEKGGASSETLARQWLEQGIKAAPEFAPSYRLLAGLRIKAGDAAGARSFLERAQRLGGL